MALGAADTEHVAGATSAREVFEAALKPPWREPEIGSG
jgi:hypothetical protein